MDELLANRTKIRSKATKLCNEFKSYREGDRKAIDSDQLALKLHHLEKLQNEIRGIQVQLDKMGQADDTNHVQNLEEEVFLGSRLLARLEKAEEAQDKAEHQMPTAYTELKTALSLEIPTFQGDVMKWAEFWELFVFAVHKNPKFANVQKFVVLRSHLAGVALRAIQGIPVTGTGYTQAVEILAERFDLPDVRKETLLRELLNMPSVLHNDLKAMRAFIDHLVAHTRALCSLGVSTESFSSLLLPFAKEKIPGDWRLEWARRESGNFDEFLCFLQKEIRIRESARGVTTPSSTANATPTAHSVVRSLYARCELRSVGSRPPQKTESACARGKGQHRVAQCAESPRMPVGARWGAAASSSICERSPEASVSFVAPSQPEPGRKENARRCAQQELLEPPAPEPQDPHAVDQPGTALPENQDDGSSGLTPVTPDDDENEIPRQNDPDVGHCLIPEREVGGPDVGHSLSPARKRSPDVGQSFTLESEMKPDPDVGQCFAPEIETHGPDAGQSFMTEVQTQSPDVGGCHLPVEAGVSSKGMVTAGRHDGDSLASEHSTDDRQMGGVMVPERRSDADGHDPAPVREPDGFHVGGGAAPEQLEGPGARGLPPGDNADGPSDKLGPVSTDPTWVKVGRSSHDTWDPGGAALLICPPSA